ncbi:MBL fold metallo-hydrolase [Desulfococcaceae bacterium HSG8]|nr:MBL fold metallo-hydrolase [Desulfococcaceae bacterium HSG8]
MNIRFWGVRGSIATPLTSAELTARIEMAVNAGLKAGLTDESQIPVFARELPGHITQVIGGNTACIEVQAGSKLLILDAGTGIRLLGLDLVQRHRGNPFEAHILLTHTHWDHISGLPFFVPAFNPKNDLTVYGPSSGLEDRLKGQQTPEYFPVPLLKTFNVFQLKNQNRFRIGDVRIETLPLNHPGDSYAYRIACGDKTLVYATDSEYKDLSTKALKPFTDFFRGADILIYDAQFTLLENIEKEDWGHSNMFCGIDMALEAGVKTLVFTHHEPVYEDKKLWETLEKANEYMEICQPPGKRIKLYLATEGLEISI